MPQLHRFLRKGNVIFADNTTQQFQLDRGQVYREIILHLTGAATVTAGNNTGANLRRMECWSLLKNIQILIGSNVIRSFSGDELAMTNYFFLSGGFPKRETTFGDGATANPSFDRCLTIPFWMPKSVNPDATLLDARAIAQLTLQVQWGTWTDINSAATGWTTQPVLEIWQRFVFPPPGDATTLRGPFATWMATPLVTPYPAAVKNAQIILPVGDVYRGFMMNTSVGSPAVDTPGILNEFRWKSGSTIYADLTEEVLREQAAMYSGTYDLYLRDGSGRKISASTSFNILAWYLWDHAMSGRLSEGVDTMGFAQMTLENDLTGQANANLAVHAQLLIPVR